MNILLITYSKLRIFFVGIIVSEKMRESVFGHFSLGIYIHI